MMDKRGPAVRRQPVRLSSAPCLVALLDSSGSSGTLPTANFFSLWEQIVFSCFLFGVSEIQSIISQTFQEEKVFVFNQFKFFV